MSPSKTEIFIAKQEQKETTQILPNPEIKTSKDGKSRDMNIREQTIFHMGVYDIEVMDTLRKKLHEIYIASFSNPEALYLCLEIGEQMFLTYRFLLAKEHGDRMDKKVEKFREKLKAQLPAGATLNDAAYKELRLDMLDIIQDLYELKHKAGLRIPSERVKNAEAKIDEATIGKI